MAGGRGGGRTGGREAACLPPSPTHRVGHHQKTALSAQDTARKPRPGPARRSAPNRPRRPLAGRRAGAPSWSHLAAPSAPTQPWAQDPYRLGRAPGGAPRAAPAGRPCSGCFSSPLAPDSCTPPAHCFLLALAPVSHGRGGGVQGKVSESPPPPAFRSCWRISGRAPVLGAVQGRLQAWPSLLAGPGGTLRGTGRDAGPFGSPSRPGAAPGGPLQSHCPSRGELLPARSSPAGGSRAAGHGKLSGPCSLEIPPPPVVEPRALRKQNSMCSTAAKSRWVQGRLQPCRKPGTAFRSLEREDSTPQSPQGRLAVEPPWAGVQGMWSGWAQAGGLSQPQGVGLCRSGTAEGQSTWGAPEHTQSPSNGRTWGRAAAPSWGSPATPEPEGAH